jgi:two-component system, OmpR family, sensor kinase
VTRRAPGASLRVSLGAGGLLVAATALAGARRAVVAEQRLTSEMAHELRAPLAATLATAEVVALREDLDAELRGDLDAIARSCREMAATVTALLELARSRSGPDVRERTRVDDVVAGVLRDLGRDGRRVRVSVGPGVEVATSPRLAACAIAPVIENAVRLAGQVDVSAYRRGRWVVVEVADDGPGVDAGAASAVFRPGRPGATGSGLGLPLARRVARSLGGDVTLSRRRARRGTVFVVRLPAA